MGKYQIAFFVAAAFSLFFPDIAKPCTSFELTTRQGPIVGRNYDWTVGDGMAVINPRNLKKVAEIQDSLPLTWKARYGSVTFNQFGRELPVGELSP
jgi:penicillin V acylase-like amidase (Ntn superfamily)